MCNVAISRCAQTNESKPINPCECAISRAEACASSRYTSRCIGETLDQITIDRLIVLHGAIVPAYPSLLRSKLRRFSYCSQPVVNIAVASCTMHRPRSGITIRAADPSGGRLQASICYLREGKLASRNERASVIKDAVLQKMQIRYFALSIDRWHARCEVEKYQDVQQTSHGW